MDPVDVRRKNLIKSDAFPRDDRGGHRVRHRRLRAVARSRARSGRLRRAARRAKGPARARRRQATRHRRVGLRRDHLRARTRAPRSGARSRSTRDGSATIYSGSMPHGQGHATALAMLVTEQTGIPMDKIDLVQGDTDEVPKGGGTNASKSLQAGGSAVYVSAAKVVDQARQLAAELLEASAGRRRARQGRRVASTCRAHRPRRVSWAEVVARGGRRRPVGHDRRRAGGVLVPVRRAPRRRRGRHRDRRGRGAARRHVRRLRHDPQPEPRRGPASRRHRAGRRAGACSKRCATTTTATR